MPIRSTTRVSVRPVLRSSTGSTLPRITPRTSLVIISAVELIDESMED